MFFRGTTFGCLLGSCSRGSPARPHARTYVVHRVATVDTPAAPSSSLPSASSAIFVAPLFLRRDGGAPHSVRLLAADPVASLVSCWITQPGRASLARLVPVASPLSTPPPLTSRYSRSARTNEILRKSVLERPCRKTIHAWSTRGRDKRKVRHSYRRMTSSFLFCGHLTAGLGSRTSAEALPQLGVSRHLPLPAARLPHTSGIPKRLGSDRNGATQGDTGITTHTPTPYARAHFVCLPAPLLGPSPAIAAAVAPPSTRGGCLSKLTPVGARSAHRAPFACHRPRTATGAAPRRCRELRAGCRRLGCQRRAPGITTSPLSPPVLRHQGPPRPCRPIIGPVTTPPPRRPCPTRPCRCRPRHPAHPAPPVPSHRRGQTAVC